MYTIEKFRHNEVIKSVKTNDIKSKGITWVVMLDNEPVFIPNRLIGKRGLLVYSWKDIAQNEADWLNKN